MVTVLVVCRWEYECIRNSYRDDFRWLGEENVSLGINFVNDIYIYTALKIFGFFIRKNIAHSELIKSHPY